MKHRLKKRILASRQAATIDYRKFLKSIGIEHSCFASVSVVEAPNHYPFPLYERP